MAEPAPHGYEGDFEVPPDSDLLPRGDDASWLPPVQARLAEAWRAGRTAPDEPKMCVLANDVGSGKGHLSLPCSIADDDDMIARFLDAPAIERDPIVFARLLLFLLDDFIESLQSCYKFLGAKKAPRAPNLVSTWTNNWAKHRKNIAILHHPKYLFLDHPDARRWERAARSAHEVVLIDSSWFEGRKRLPNPEEVRANDQPAVVVFPRFIEFLSGATSYYDEFVSQASATPDKLERFETADHDLGFQTLLDRIVPHLDEPSALT